jgi:hypothetical protein
VLGPRDQADRQGAVARGWHGQLSSALRPPLKISSESVLVCSSVSNQSVIFQVRAGGTEQLASPDPMSWANPCKAAAHSEQ